jgi:lysophospholipase L1-like esterase
VTRGLTLTTALLAACATLQAQAAERILLMGDSQAFLLKEELGEHARQAGHTFASVPVAGSTIIQWAEPKNDRWDIRKQWQLVHQFKPTIIVLSLGTNDAYMGCRIIKNEPPYLARLLRRLERTGASKIVWAGPPVLVRATKGLACLVDMLGRAGVLYLDARELVGMTYWDDRLHPDQVGQRLWADWLWRKVNEQVLGAQPADWRQGVVGAVVEGA